MGVVVVFHRRSLFQKSLALLSIAEINSFDDDSFADYSTPPLLRFVTLSSTLHLDI